ncbi:VOC family protein [Sinorhizobium meliloti]|uniref:VOC family protein n=1 Tax=Rhizobium meliloti TaxID=382 RepID=UPI000FD892E9|nr:VOC family protein [Sinorhizobium meliloti]RVE87074.1 hypothetical protein CN238_20145 [Sinorhizobium meliloti]
MILRIDNIFFNTPDVDALADYYSSATGLPARRKQVEAPGLMWAEISIGGMELSFRKAQATPLVHTRAKDTFVETPPGSGATISFEVNDTDAERNRLGNIGAKLHGDPLDCSGGQEIISIFSDPSGRPVQLYEPRFNSTSDLVTAARSSPTMALLTSRPIQFGSNLRGTADMAYSVSIIDDDLQVMESFYSDLLEEKPVFKDTGRVTFDVDGSVLEIRSSQTYAELHGMDEAVPLGVIPLLETRSAARTMAAFNRGSMTNMIVANARPYQATGSRAAIRDPDGNHVEFWERPATI